MKRAVIAGTAAAGLAIAAGACGGSPAHHGAARPAAGRATGTWTIASCQVDVTYIDDSNAANYFLPDTAANFRHYIGPGQASAGAGMAVVVTFVNATGGPAPLPAGLVVSFTDRRGHGVGHPLSFNSPYGSAVAHGHGSGETFSSGTVFSSGQRIAESPDIGASVPQRPDLSCSVSGP